MDHLRLGSHWEEGGFHALCPCSEVENYLSFPLLFEFRRLISCEIVPLGSPIATLPVGASFAIVVRGMEGLILIGPKALRVLGVPLEKGLFSILHQL